jgi:hypothetical protein
LLYYSQELKQLIKPHQVHDCDRTTSGRGSSPGSTWAILGEARTQSTHITTISYIEVQVKVITAFVHVLIIQRRIEAKITLQRINQSLRKWFLSTVRTSSLPKKRMSSIGILSLRISVRSPTRIGLDVPLTTLVGIAGKRKQFLTCTQKTSRAKLERLCSGRLIQGDQKITSRHAEVWTRLKDS